MIKELSAKFGSRIVKEVRTLVERYVISFGRIRLPIKLNHVTMLQIHYTRGKVFMVGNKRRGKFE